MAEDQYLQAQLPLEHVGVRLRIAREAAGLSRAEISARTKIPDRHLAAIEAGDFAALTARAYAVGFARSYARAVGLQPEAIADGARAQFDAATKVEERRPANFEPGDPSRVPGRHLAWLAAAGALAVVLAVLYFWRSYYSPAAPLPPLVAEKPSGSPSAAPAASAVTPVASAQPAAPAAALPAQPPARTRPAVQRTAPVAAAPAAAAAPSPEPPATSDDPAPADPAEASTVSQ